MEIGDTVERDEITMLSLAGIKVVVKIQLLDVDHAKGWDMGLITVQKDFVKRAVTEVMMHGIQYGLIINYD